jgi:hypothetical protein
VGSFFEGKGSRSRFIVSLRGFVMKLASEGSCYLHGCYAYGSHINLFIKSKASEKVFEKNRSLTISFCQKINEAGGLHGWLVFLVFPINHIIPNYPRSPDSSHENKKGHYFRFQYFSCYCA